MSEIAQLVCRIELARDLQGVFRALNIATNALGELAESGNSTAQAAVVAMAHTLGPAS